MKKFILLSSVSVIAAVSAFAQNKAPQSFNYQGAARKPDGTPLANTNISLRLSIVADAPNGTTEYYEVRSVKTNALGLYTVQMGSGISGEGNSLLLTGGAVTFNNIAWGANAKYFRVEVDPNNGNNFTLAGTSPIAAVPYALYAEKGGTSAYNYWVSLPENAGKTPADFITYLKNEASGNVTKSDLTASDADGILTVDGGQGAVLNAATIKLNRAAFDKAAREAVINGIGGNDGGDGTGTALTQAITNLVNGGAVTGKDATVNNNGANQDGSILAFNANNQAVLKDLQLILDKTALNNETKQSIINGLNGLNGTNGVNGLDGQLQDAINKAVTNGLDGVAGTNGSNGADGVNTKLVESITKLIQESVTAGNIQGKELAASYPTSTPEANKFLGITGNGAEALLKEAQVAVDPVKFNQAVSDAITGANGANGADGINGQNGTNGIGKEISSTDLEIQGGDKAVLNPVTLNIKDGAITNGKLAPDAVTSDKILNGTIATEDLADGAVTPQKMGGAVAADAGKVLTVGSDGTVSYQTPTTSVTNVTDGKDLAKTAASDTVLDIVAIQGGEKSVLTETSLGIDKAGFDEAAKRSVINGLNGTDGTNGTNGELIDAIKETIIKEASGTFQVGAAGAAPTGATDITTNPVGTVTAGVDGAPATITINKAGENAPGVVSKTDIRDAILGNGTTDTVGIGKDLVTKGLAKITDGTGVGATLKGLTIDVNADSVKQVIADGILNGKDGAAGANGVDGELVKSIETIIKESADSTNFKFTAPIAATQDVPTAVTGTITPGTENTPAQISIITAGENAKGVLSKTDVKDIISGTNGENGIGEDFKTANVNGTGAEVNILQIGATNDTTTAAAAALKEIDLRINKGALNKNTTDALTATDGANGADSLQTAVKELITNSITNGKDGAAGANGVDGALVNNIETIFKEQINSNLEISSPNAALTGAADVADAASGTITPGTATNPAVIKLNAAGENAKGVVSNQDIRNAVAGNNAGENRLDKGTISKIEGDDNILSIEGTPANSTFQDVQFGVTKGDVQGAVVEGLASGAAAGNRELKDALANTNAEALSAEPGTAAEQKFQDAVKNLTSSSADELLAVGAPGAAPTDAADVATATIGTVTPGTAGAPATLTINEAGDNAKGVLSKTDVKNIISGVDGENGIGKKLTTESFITSSNEQNKALLQELAIGVDNDKLNQEVATTLRNGIDGVNGSNPLADAIKDLTKGTTDLANTAVQDVTITGTGAQAIEATKGADNIVSLDVKKAGDTTPGVVTLNEMKELISGDGTPGSNGIGKDVTAGSDKVTLDGTPVGAALKPFSIDVNEANLNLANIGGELPVAKLDAASAPAGAVPTTDAAGNVTWVVPSADALANKHDITNTSDITATNGTGAVVGAGNVALTINDNAITNTKLAPDAVTTDKIADGTIATADLANDAVTVDKIGATATDAGKVMSVDAAGNVTWVTPSTSATNVTDAKGITSTDNTITVGNGAQSVLKDVTLDVNEANLDLANIGGKLPVSKLDATAADAGKVPTVGADGTVTYQTPTASTTGITDGKALTSTDLDVSANGTTALLKDVTLNIKDGAITSAKILDGTITGVDVAANTLTGGNIQNGTVLGEDLAPKTVTADRLTAPTGAPAGQVLTTNADGTVTYQTPTASTTSITDGKALTSTDLVVSANGTTALLKDVTLNIKDGAITSAKIADGAVSNADLAPDAVTTDKIANNTITGTDVANATLAPSKLAATTADAGKVPVVGTDGTVTWAAPAGSDASTIGNKKSIINTTDITATNGSGAVVSAADVSLTINNGAITTTKLADNAVTSAKIADGAVTSADIADKTIAGGDIADKTVTSTNLTSGTATNGQVLIADGAGGFTYGTPSTGVANITDSKTLTTDGIIVIGNNTSSTTTQVKTLLADATLSIKNGSITATQLADNAVTSAKIADGAVTSADIADNTITGTDVANATLAPSKLSATTADAGKVPVVGTDGTVTWAAPAGSDASTINNKKSIINSSDILVTNGTGSVVSAADVSMMIANNAITSAKIADGAVTSADIADKTITGGDIADKTVTTTNITSGTATAGQVLVADGSGNVSYQTPTTNATNVTGGQDVTAGSTKVTLGGTPTGAALKAFSVDVNEANLNLANIGGKLPVTKLNATAADAGKVPTVDAAGNVSYQTPSTSASNVTNAQALSTDGIIVIGDATSTTVNQASTLLAGAKLSVKNGSITATQLADNAVNSAKIADGTITGTDVAPKTITASNLVGGTAGQVPTSAADGTVTWAAPAAYQEPWNVQNSTTPATTNTQNIYQTGNIGVGNFGARAVSSQVEIYGSSTSQLGITNSATNIKWDMSNENNAGTSVFSFTHRGTSNNVRKLLLHNDGSLYLGNSLLNASKTGANTAAGFVYDGTNAALGINLPNTGTGLPTEKLDINGNARIRALANNTANTDVVTADANGVLSRRAISTLSDANTLSNKKDITSTDLSVTNGVGSVVSAANVVLDIKDGAVTSAKILDGTIATADLTNGAVTPAKMSSGGAAVGTVPVANADGTVTYQTTSTLVKFGQQKFVATAGQTSYPVTNLPADHTKVYVFRNGVKLVANEDYTVTAGTVTIVPTNFVNGTVAAQDVIEVQFAL